MTSEAFFRIHQDAYFETRNEGPPELAANQKFVACVVEIDITEERNPTVNQNLIEIDQLDSWTCHAADRTSKSDQFLGGFRLILGTFTARSSSLNLTMAAASKKSFPSYEHKVLNSQISVLSRQQREGIIQAFGLPAATSWAFNTDSTHFQRYSVNDDRSLGITMRQSTKGGLDIDLAFSMSYHYESKMTYGVLLGCSEQQANYIRTRLTEMSCLALHPLLLPTILVGCIRSFLGRRVEELWLDLLAVEADSGLTKWRVPDVLGRVKKPTKCKNYRKASEDVLGVIQSTTIWQRHVDTLLLIIDSMQECNKFLHFEKRFDQTKAMVNTHMAIEERLRFVWSKSKIMLVLLQSIEKRTGAQMTAVYNFLADSNNELNRQLGIDTREIAEASMRDSSAMKSIAVLTMVFLPGTYLATLFAMPVFNWSAGPDQTIVLPRFWVYWAFAIPLTFIVLAVWLLFMAWSELRRKRSHAKRQKRVIGRLSATHSPRSVLSRIQARRKQVRSEPDPENINEIHSGNWTNLEQQETADQIVHVDSTNTNTILMGGEQEKTKQRRANYSRGYDYLFPRIDPDSAPQVDAISSSETKLDDFGRPETPYQR